MQSVPIADDAIAETIDDGAYKNLDMRGTQAPIPSNLNYFLTDAQIASWRKLEIAGWRLLFVRRPLFEPATVAVQSPEQLQVASIEVDGTLDFEPATLLRA